MSELLAESTATPIGAVGLDAFVGKSVVDICAFGFGSVGDDHNHCAHFVGHALRATSLNGTTCDSLLPKGMGKKHPMYGQRGVLVRVHQLYATVTGKTKVDVAAPVAPESGLIFVSKTTNFSDGVESMGNIPKKHVGIVNGGNVYHYGNTADAVRKDSLSAFITRMTNAYGGGVTFVTSNLP